MTDTYHSLIQRVYEEASLTRQDLSPLEKAWEELVSAMSSGPRLSGGYTYASLRAALGDRPAKRRFNLVQSVRQGRGSEAVKSTDAIWVLAGGKRGGTKKKKAARVFKTAEPAAAPHMPERLQKTRRLVELDWSQHRNPLLIGLLALQNGLQHGNDNIDRLQRQAARAYAFYLSFAKDEDTQKDLEKLVRDEKSFAAPPTSPKKASKKQQK